MKSDSYDDGALITSQQLWNYFTFIGSIPSILTIIKRELKWLTFCIFHKLYGGGESSRVSVTWFQYFLSSMRLHWINRHLQSESKKNSHFTKMLVTYNRLGFQPFCFLCKWANIMTTHSCKIVDLWPIIRKWQLLL